MAQQNDNQQNAQQDRSNVTKPVTGQEFADKKNLKQDQSQQKGSNLETEEGMDSDSNLGEDGKH